MNSSSKQIGLRLLTACAFIASVFGSHLALDAYSSNPLSSKLIYLPLISSPHIVKISKQVRASTSYNYPFDYFIQGELETFAPNSQIVLEPILKVETVNHGGEPYKTITATSYFSAVLSGSNFFVIPLESSGDCWPNYPPECFAGTEPYTLTVEGYKLGATNVFTSPQINVEVYQPVYANIIVTTTVKNSSADYSIKNIKVLTLIGLTQKAEQVATIPLLKPLEEKKIVMVASTNYNFIDPDYPPVAYAQGEIVR